MCLQVLGNAAAHVKKGSIKPFVAPEEAACHLHESCLQWCHSVAMLHCGYCMHLALKSRPLVQHSSNTFKLSMDSFSTNVPTAASAEAQIAPFTFHTFLLVFQNLALTVHYPQCILATEWSLEAISVSNYMHLRSGLQKALSYFFHICSKTNKDL